MNQREIRLGSHPWTATPEADSGKALASARAFYEKPQRDPKLVAFERGDWALPEPDYAAIEAEHFGCPEKQTGIYAPPAPQDQKAVTWKVGDKFQVVKAFRHLDIGQAEHIVTRVSTDCVWATWHGKDEFFYFYNIEPPTELGSQKADEGVEVWRSKANHLLYRKGSGLHSECRRNSVWGWSVFTNSEIASNPSDFTKLSPSEAAALLKA